jgi:hypothetical protein
LKTEFRAETTGKDEVEGHSCFVVRITPLGPGTPETVWFETDSGLPIKFTSTVRNPAGDITVTQIVSDYRDVDGIKLPHHWEMTAGVPMSIDLSEIRINGELPTNVFDLPSDVKALAERESKKP